MATRIITNIPADKVPSIIDLHEIAGATNIRTLKEPDGEFTVIAFYPEIERFSEIVARRPQASAA